MLFYSQLIASLHMSFIYPPYSNVENEFYRLWSIRDNSWGFYSYDVTYTKRSGNKEYENLYFYWNNYNDLFKIRYDNYEGVFNKKNYEYLSYGYAISCENTIMFCKVFENIKLKELTDKYAIFEYQNNTMQNNTMQFRLNYVDIDYIKNIDNDTTEINNAIKKTYEEGIKWRIQILSESTGDY